MANGKLSKKIQEKFSYDVSDLTAYVDEQSTDIIAELAYNSKLKSRIQIMDGVKGSEKIKMMAMDFDLQSGEACGRTPEGSIIFTDKTLSTSPIKVDMSVCNKDLTGFWTQALLALGQNRQNQDLIFADVVSALTVKKSQKKDQDLMFKGDTTSLDPNLAFYDGFLKLWNADANVPTITTLQTTMNVSNAFAIAQQMAQSVSTLLLDNGIKPEIGISRKTANLIINNIWNDKDYNAILNVVEDGEELSFVLPTTTITFRTYPQIPESATGDEPMYIMPYEFMFYGTDLEGDDSEFVLFYDQKDEAIYFGLNWLSGVNYVYPEYFGKLAYS